MVYIVAVSYFWTVCDSNLVWTPYYDDAFWKVIYYNEVDLFTLPISGLILIVGFYIRILKAL